jgi:hypothetical protein
MVKKLTLVLTLVLSMASGYAGLFGVIRGGTIHQYTPRPMQMRAGFISPTA